MKTCGRCKQVLPTSSFRWKNKEKNQFQSYCIDCNKAKNKEHYLANKQSYLDKQKDYRSGEDFAKTRRAKTYGLTVEELDQMIVDTEGKCMICSEPAVHVDHDHAAGKVRGLLCKSCNNGLGFFKDSSELMRRAAEYLDEWRSDCVGTGS